MYSRFPMKGLSSRHLRNKRSCAIFEMADPSLQDELDRISHLRRYAAGETVIGEAEDADIVGNVVSGVLRVQKSMADGRQQIVGLLLPSDIFGRVFASTSQVAIEAATDVALCCYNRSAFEMLLSRHPELEHEILLAVLDEMDAARDWMLLLGCQTVMERVASFLLILLRRSHVEFSNADNITIAPYVTVPISRRDMACYLGTTVETISRTVRDFARKGVIRILDPHNFEILDRNRLARISGREEFADDLAPAEIAVRQPRHKEIRPRTLNEAGPRRRNAASVVADAKVQDKPATPLTRPYDC